MDQDQTKLKKRLLKDIDKILAEILTRIGCFCWQLVLSNGCVVSMVVSGYSGDVEKIFIDKSMVGKFTCETVCDGALF